MFARNMTKNSDFVKTFGNSQTNNHNIEPSQIENHDPQPSGALNPISTDEQSFFDFEPSSRAESPYQNHFPNSGASGMPWSNEANFRPFTPPSSATFSPKSWPYNSCQQGDSVNFFANVHPTGMRAPYGQATPPDDENDFDSLLDHQFQGQFEHQKTTTPPPPQDAGKGKRKRGPIPQDSANHSSPKRTRKYTSRRSNNTNEPTKPEDFKRSKFLERNRVAASKCRQKKKEWTQNLENRARELQKDNNQLRMVVDSCRQEILFLKGELLKHSRCDCESIQTYIKSGTTNFTDNEHEEVLVKCEQDSIKSIPSSRQGSIDAETARSDIDSTSPPAKPSNASTVDDENVLEALLTSSMNLDMMNDGIASQIPVAVAG